MDHSNARVKPYSEEAERGVLGSVMIDAEKVLGICTEQGVSESTFHVPSHGTLYGALMDMASKMMVIDQVTAGAYLEASEKMEVIGGWDLLNDLIDSTPTASHAEYYIGIIREKQILRDIISEATQAIDSCYEADVDDGAENILARTQSNLFSISSTSRFDKAETTGEAAEAVCDRWEGILDGTESFGLRPFLPEIAETLGNFVEGNPYFIAAEPGGGKSVFVQNQMTYWSLVNKVPCAIASLEMTRRKLVSRILGDRGEFSSWAMDNNELGASSYARDILGNARKAAQEVASMPLHISDMPMNVDEICAWGLMMKTKHGIKALGIDYMQLVNPPDKLRLQGIEALKYTCGKLQNFSKETGIITLVLSQITKLEMRDGKKRKPVQDDMFGGRLIDATSEGTIMLYNWEEQDYASIVKNRNGGTGEIPVTFEKNRQRFKTPKAERY